MAQALFDTIRTKAGTGGVILSTYTTIGGTLTHPVRAFCIINNTNGDLFFSLDGVNDQLFVPANFFRLYDVSTNAPPVKNLDSLLIGIGVQFYVRYSTVPSSGAVYIETIYAKGE